MLLQLVNMLTWWQWLILAAVPPAILALYFLKLKRRPLEVPSTYLWHRSVEDLHVNTIWQRLRRNLLLFLQLVLLFLAMLAVLRPGWRGAKAVGDRFIFLVDNSASMEATDTGHSRLEEAKRRVREKIDQMTAGDVAMIVSFSDAPDVKQSFTHSRRSLKRALDSIRPTVRPTSIGEALRVASGLANPGHAANPEDVRDSSILVADPLPATLFIFSDGDFPDAADFRLGNLEPVYMPVGSSQASNVAILAFSVRRQEADPLSSQAFARLGFYPKRLFTLEPEYQNRLGDGPVSEDLRRQFAAHEIPLSPQGRVKADPMRGQWWIDDGGRGWLIEKADALEVYEAKTTVSVELYLDGALQNADRVEVLARQSTGVSFDLGVAESGVLELRIAGEDDLACDNVAWTVVNPPQRAKVVLVTPGNKVLDFAFGTEAVEEMADVAVASPDVLDAPAYRRQAAAGAYDLVIYDRCRPEEMPQANTLFIGALPPAPEGERGEQEEPKPKAQNRQESMDERTAWNAGPSVSYPAITYTDPSHPLMQWLELGDVELAKGTPLVVPRGGSVLIDSHVGPMFAVAPRERFEDAVMGFVLLDEQAGDDGTPGTYIGTNWWMKPSFPVFVLNLLKYLGGSGSVVNAAFEPGQPARLESPASGQSLEVRTPSGQRIDLEQSTAGSFTFTGTYELGVYEVRSSGKILRHFAVNLFHDRESDIRPRAKIKIGRGDPIEAPQSAWETARHELWKPLLLVALAILGFEWYVYNRRVYL